MKILFALSLICVCILGCSKKITEIKSNIPVLTDKKDLDQYVGKTITIQGVVSNTKVPTIIGVDVDSFNPDLRGKKAQATGVLIKWTVDPKDVDPYSQNRGAGTFYRLKDPNSEYDVQVQKIK